MANERDQLIAIVMDVLGEHDWQLDNIDDAKELADMIADAVISKGWPVAT